MRIVFCIMKEFSTFKVVAFRNRRNKFGLTSNITYEGWNFNSGKYLFTTDTKYVNTCFEVLLSFNVVTSIVYNPLPGMWKS